MFGIVCNFKNLIVRILQVQLFKCHELTDQADNFLRVKELLWANLVYVCTVCKPNAQTVPNMGLRSSAWVHAADPLYRFNAFQTATCGKLLLSLHKDDITTLGWRWATELMATTFLDLRKGSKVSFSLSLDQSTNHTNYTIHPANSSSVGGNVVREGQMHHFFRNSLNLCTGLCNTHQYIDLISDAQALVLKRKTGIFLLYTFQIFLSNMPYR